MNVKNMKVMTKIILILSIAALTACNGSKNLARDNSVDYKSIKQLPEMHMPEIQVPVNESSDSEQKK